MIMPSLTSYVYDFRIALQNNSKIVIFFLNAIKLIFIRSFMIKYFKYVFWRIIIRFFSRRRVKKEFGKSDISNVPGFRFLFLM